MCSLRLASVLVAAAVLACAVGAAQASPNGPDDLGAGAGWLQMSPPAVRVPYWVPTPTPLPRPAKPVPAWQPIPLPKPQVRPGFRLPPPPAATPIQLP